MVVPSDLEILRSLPPLAIPHYTFSLPPTQLTAPSAELREVLRICGGLGIQVHFLTEERLTRTAELASALNLPVAVHYSPWTKLRDNDPRGLLEEFAEFDSR